MKVILLYTMLISGISPLHNIDTGLEHFPYGLILIILFAKIRLYPIILLSIITIFYTISILYYYHDENYDFRIILGVVQMINFISPLFFYKGNERLISRAAEHIFWIYLIVGLMQMAHLLVVFEPIIQIFISRFEGAPIGGYRGVTMLETEPARAAFQLFILYVISTILRPKYFHYKTIALIIGIFILNGSATGIILLLVYFGCLWLPRISLFKIIVGASAIFSIGYYFGSAHPKVSILIDFYRTGGLQGLYTAFSAISGGRFLATVESIDSIIRWPLGYGANPDFLLSEKIELGSDVQGYSTRVSARPVSAILNYLYYFGLLMLIPLWLAIRSNVWKPQFSTQAIALIIIGVIYTPPGNEAWMIAFCMALSHRTAFAQFRATEPPSPIAKDFDHVPSSR